MSAVSNAAEQRVVLHNVSWETYERILAETIDFTKEGADLGQRHSVPPRMARKK